MTTPFQLAQAKQVEVGNDAGWVLAFHRETPLGIDPTPELELSSTDYYASIDAALPDTLGPGAYRIAIEGLVDEHFAKLGIGQDKQPLTCKLFLFWRDANSSAKAYLTNLAGVSKGPSAADLQEALVAVLRVTKVRRSAGERTYDTELTLVEEAYARLGANRVAERFEAENFRAAIRAIADRTKVEFVVWGDNPDGTMTRARGEASGEEKVTFGAGLLFTAAVQRLAGALEQSLNLYGRGMLMIRDGTVHVGKRPIPYPEGEPKPLTLASGLLQPVQDGEEESDPFAATEIGGEAPPKRAAWTLTLKGRPDLKPGDVVRFEPPPDADAKTLAGLGTALAGSFAAPFLPSIGELTDRAKLLYVSSSRHTLSRSAGFVTVVRGVEIDGTGDQAWDKRSDSSSAAPPPAASSAASPGVSAAGAVVRAARRATGEVRTVEVGEVRAAATSASGTVEPPAQTEIVWEGLAARDGRANGARRLAVRREHPSPLNGVAYLTPFAWGGCGLILPRYPGTRVALGYRNGEADDPVDLGAIWQSGHAPVSQPGDWWLLLPVGVPSDRRSSIADTATAADHGGKVVHDLTDGDGNRVIEVGELTVRVGRAALKGRSQRPARAADADSITIEHTGGGSKVEMKQDGSVTIKGARIELDAGRGTITLKAGNVDVQVQNSMEVH
jgi:hypothetical protein